jgi:hypothetical protein
MQSAPARKSDGYPAPCRGARRLLVIVISTSVLLVLATTADRLLRVPRQDQPARAWMNRLTLSAPALWTAGAPLRHPETGHPGVDPRFCPGLATLP